MGFARCGFFRRTFAHVDADVAKLPKRVRIYGPKVGGNMAYSFFVGDFSVYETGSKPTFGIDFREIFDLLFRERFQHPVQNRSTDQLEIGGFPKRLKKRAIAEGKRFYGFSVFREHDVRSSVDVSAKNRVKGKILHRSVFEPSLDAVEIRPSSKILSDADAAIGSFGDEKMGIDRAMAHGYNFTV